MSNNHTASRTIQIQVACVDTMGHGGTSRQTAAEGHDMGLLHLVCWCPYSVLWPDNESWPQWSGLQITGPIHPSQTASRENSLYNENRPLISMALDEIISPCRLPQDSWPQTWDHWSHSTPCAHESRPRWCGHGNDVLGPHMTVWSQWRPRLIRSATT